MEIYYACKIAYDDSTKLISDMLDKIENKPLDIEIAQEKLNLIKAILSDGELLRFGKFYLYLTVYNLIVNDFRISYYLLCYFLM